MRWWLQRIGGVATIVVAVAGCGRRREHGPAAVDAGRAVAAAITRPAEPLPPPKAEPALVVVTYNMLFKRAGSEASMTALRSAQADIAILQEITPEWERALREHMGGSYPHMRFNAARAGGVAVLSRWPLGEVTLLPAPRWFPALRVAVDTPSGPVQVIAVHLRPPRFDRTRPLQALADAAAARRQEIEAYWKALDVTPPTLIAGDFNESREGSAVGFLVDQGLGSALAAVDPDTATWHGTVSGAAVTWQLDHGMFDPRFAVVSAGVIHAGDSDHFPLVARLKMARP
jgi:endonuclease/exonuclease/phosphatase family metal-dependent hydrolase